jgi:hypothetical protein
MQPRHSAVAACCRKTETVTVRPFLFWDAQQRILVISYRRFGTTHRSHRQGCSRLRRLITDVSDKLSVPSSRMQYSKKVSYRRFGTTYRSHRQRCSRLRRLITDVSVKLSVPSSRMQYSKLVADVSEQPICPIVKDAVG